MVHRVRSNSPRSNPRRPRSLYRGAGNPLPADERMVGFTRHGTSNSFPAGRSIPGAGTTRDGAISAMGDAVARHGPAGFSGRVDEVRPGLAAAGATPPAKRTSPSNPHEPTKIPESAARGHIQSEPVGSRGIEEPASVAAPGANPCPRKPPRRRRSALRSGSTERGSPRPSGSRCPRRSRGQDGRSRSPGSGRDLPGWDGGPQGGNPSARAGGRECGGPRRRRRGTLEIHRSTLTPSSAP